MVRQLIALSRKLNEAMRVSRLLLVMLSLTAQVSCQVLVSTTLTKPEYLEGEPVEVIVKITNVGSDAVTYEQGAGDVVIQVEGQEKRPAPPNIWGCFAGEGGGVGGGIDHPPLLQPSASVEFKYLLRDYQLHPGHYTLHTSGRVGVSWKAYASDGVSPKFHESDVVPGTEFDSTLALRVRAGSASGAAQGV